MLEESIAGTVLIDNSRGLEDHKSIMEDFLSKHGVSFEDQGSVELTDHLEYLTEEIMSLCPESIAFMVGPSGDWIFAQICDCGEALFDPLCGADLRDADLRDADLCGADLRGADLRDADLRGADLPSPTIVLLACWRHVSSSLCVEMMLFDQSNHPHPEMFDNWASGGACPYDTVKVQRAASFNEHSQLWLKRDKRRKRPLSAFELMRRVIREKCCDSDYHTSGYHWCDNLCRHLGDKYCTLFQKDLIYSPKGDPNGCHLRCSDCMKTNGGRNWNEACDGF